MTCPTTLPTYSKRLTDRIGSTKKILLITDLDGTMLPSSKIVSRDDMNKINDFRSKGGLFTIATGRSLPAAVHYLNEIKPDAPAVLYNGASVYDCISKQTVDRHYLPINAKDMLTDVCKRFPDIGVDLIASDDIVYIPQNNDLEREHVIITKVKPVYCSFDELPKDWFKLILLREADKLPELIEYVNAAGYNGIDFVKSSEIYFEALPAGCTKGSALKFLRSMPCYSDYTFVACGDFNNDIEMLMEADLSLCPANAADDVKHIAGVVLKESCEENFISAAIDYIYTQF